MRQAIAKGIVAYYQKYIDEASKKEIKDILMAYHHRHHHRHHHHHHPSTTNTQFVVSQGLRSASQEKE